MKIKSQLKKLTPPFENESYVIERSTSPLKSSKDHYHFHSNRVD